MTIEEMFDAFWLAYPTDLCRNKRGSKQNALKSFTKIKPDKEGFYLMMENMKAQIRHDRKDNDADRWPFVVTYLNQSRYKDVIENEQTSVHRQELKTCCIEKCENAVHGESFLHCVEHVPNTQSDSLGEAWKSTGMNFKSSSFVDDCRDYCRKKMGKITTKSEVFK